jgi:DNA topoisomerase-2
MEDDGVPIEPEFYIPVIPMLLVNGGIGIGTGFSTNIPCYNPKDICAVLEDKINGKTPTTVLTPWYRGFKGTIREVTPDKYISVGKYERQSDTKILITELPIGYWTFDFKEDLEKLLDELPDFKKYENNSGEDINFTLHFTSVTPYLQIDKNGLTKLETIFKLTSSHGLSTTNMYAFNSKGQITKYNTPLDIINEFYDVRLSMYQSRKAHILETMKYDTSLLENKKRFIKSVVNEQLKVHNMKKIDLETHLTTSKYMKHQDTYDYLTKLPIYNLTKDKVDELEAELATTTKNLEAYQSKSISSIWLDEIRAAT